MSVKIRRVGPPGRHRSDHFCGRRTWPATYEFADADYVADGQATWWSAAAIPRSVETTTVLVADSGMAIVGTGDIDLRP